MSAVDSSCAFAVHQFVVVPNKEQPEASAAATALSFGRGGALQIWLTDPDAPNSASELAAAFPSAKTGTTEATSTKRGKLALFIFCVL